MSKGIGITELTSILTGNPRMVGSIRGAEASGFLSTTELEALLTGSVGTADLDDAAVTTPKIADAAVTSPKLEEAAIQYAEVEILAAAVLTLFSVPVVLVAAPGANLVLEFVSLELAYDYDGVAAYTIVGCTNFQVFYTNLAGVATSTLEAVAGTIDQVVDEIRLLDKLEVSLTPVVNTPLVLTIAGADPAVGASPIHAKVAYRVHATGL